MCYGNGACVFYGGLSHGHFSLRLLRSFSWLIVAAYGIWAPPAAADPPVPDRVDLIQYVSLALRYSDSAANVQDDLFSSRLGVDLAKTEFNTRLVPLASFRFGTGTGSQQLGLEARRTNEFGTTFATGLAASKLTSNTVSIQNSYNSRAFVRLSQGLFRAWGKTYNRFGLTLSELQRREQELRGRRERQDIMLNAVQRFYAAVLSEHLVRKSRQALERASRHLEAARARQSVGLVSKVDVYRAELARLTAEDALMNQIRADQRNREQLHELLATPNIDMLRLDEDIAHMTPVIPEDWEDNLLEYRSDWQAHLVDLDIANLSLHRAERDTLPDIVLEFVLEREGFANSFDDSLGLDDTDWSLQLQLRSSLQLYEEKAALERERLTRSRLLREGQTDKRKIYREARDAMEDLAAEQRRHRINLQRLEQARQAIELSEIRYRRGLSSNLDVLDAEAAFSTAEVNILRTQVDYNIAVVRLGHALGILDIPWIQASLVPVPAPVAAR